MFSSAAEYAIRAMTFLALQPAGKLTGAREISLAEGIPMPFLWKILQNLARRRILRSFKGVRGGYELAKPADQLTVRELLDATEDRSLSRGCILGLPTCGEDHPCSLHYQWKEIREKVAEMLQSTTLADLAEAARSKTMKTHQ